MSGSDVESRLDEKLADDFIIKLKTQITDLQQEVDCLKDRLKEAEDFITRQHLGRIYMTIQ